MHNEDDKMPEEFKGMIKKFLETRSTRVPGAGGKMKKMAELLDMLGSQAAFHVSHDINTKDISMVEPEHVAALIAFNNMLESFKKVRFEGTDYTKTHGHPDPSDWYFINDLPDTLETLMKRYEDAIPELNIVASELMVHFHKVFNERSKDVPPHR